MALILGYVGFLHNKIRELFRELELLKNELDEH
jgi:hypothetical protein